MGVRVIMVDHLGKPRWSTSYRFADNNLWVSGIRKLIGHRLHLHRS